MTFARPVFGIVMLAGMLATSSGCHKSDSDRAQSAAGGATANAAQHSGPNDSPIEAEARAAALAEVKRHWVQAPEGWTTARVSGSPYAPDHYVRQIRKIEVASVESNDLGESDRMNGFEWAGEVHFASAPVREAGDPGIVLEGMADVNVNRPRGRWSQWVDYTPGSLHIQKVKGKWQIRPDTWMLSGNLPTTQDYANAGVH